jgi:hypothetical protein
VGAVAPADPTQGDDAGLDRRRLALPVPHQYRAVRDGVERSRANIAAQDSGRCRHLADQAAQVRPPPVLVAAGRQLGEVAGLDGASEAHAATAPYLS